MMGLELATPRLQTECSSHWAIQLKSYCWEWVEFIKLLYCIIIILSFLNCDWLLIREVQWFYWTQELLVPVETVSCEQALNKFQWHCGQPTVSKTFECLHLLSGLIFSAKRFLTYGPRAIRLFMRKITEAESTRIRFHIVFDHRNRTLFFVAFIRKRLKSVSEENNMKTMQKRCV